MVHQHGDVHLREDDTDDQKEWCMKTCQDILELLATEPDLLGRIITGHESCIFDYNLETKRQSYQWKSPELKVR